jgi:hypothetical protein
VAVAEFIWPAYGFGLPNTTMDAGAYALLEALQPDSVKFIASNYPPDANGLQVLQAEVRRVRAIRHGVTIYARLPDSFAGTERVKGLVEYADECSRYIDAYLACGVNSYQIGNEDQARGAARQPLTAWVTGGVADAPYANAYFYLELFAHLRQRYGRNVRLGAAPLMHSYLTEYTAWYDARRPLYAVSDFVCANCYFESKDALTDPDYGASWRWLKDRTSKPIVIAEYNVPPRPLEPVAIRESRQQTLVPAWWETLLDEGQVEAAHLFGVRMRWGWEAWSPALSTVKAWASWRAGLELTLKGQVAA